MRTAKSERGFRQSLSTLGNHCRFHMLSLYLHLEMLPLAAELETGLEEDGSGGQQPRQEGHTAIQNRAWLEETGPQAASRSAHPTPPCLCPAASQMLHGQAISPTARIMVKCSATLCGPGGY